MRICVDCSSSHLLFLCELPGHPLPVGGGLLHRLLRSLRLGLQRLQLRRLSVSLLRGGGGCSFRQLPRVLQLDGQVVLPGETPPSFQQGSIQDETDEDQTRDATGQDRTRCMLWPALTCRRLERSQLLSILPQSRVVASMDGVPETSWRPRDRLASRRQAGVPETGCAPQEQAAPGQGALLPGLLPARRPCRGAPAGRAAAAAPAPPLTPAPAAAAAATAAGWRRRRPRPPASLQHCRPAAAPPPAAASAAPLSPRCAPC